MKKIRSVGLIVENSEGEILALLRRDDKSEGNKWGLVAGRIERKEPKEEAIIREAYEETRLVIQTKDLDFIGFFKWLRDNLIIEFTVYKLEVETNTEIVTSDDEFKNYMWISPKTLAKRSDLRQGLHDVLETIYKIT
mgnify:CR=1 FL=1